MNKLQLENPFPGLRPFQENEEHLFFGRERGIDRMVDRLARSHFLAVVGTSGSGKSSLVNCGLRPALRHGLMAKAGTSWRMAQFRPAGRPIHELARALAADGVLYSAAETEGIHLERVFETTLRMSRRGLLDVVEKARLPEHTNLLVVVDQFEELFRYADPSADDATASEFVNLLLAVLENLPQRIYIVITMRSDFLGDCARFQGLPEAVNEGQYLIPRLTRAERRAVITGPIAVAGGRISPVLVNRLVNDVGDDPDQLSVLQHALHRTWANRQREDGEGQLELAHYTVVGGMKSALDGHANDAYEQLTAPQRVTCEKLFKALTDKTGDGRGVRRPTAFATLCQVCGADRAEVAAIIDVFRDPERSFLMPPAGVALEDETIVDISHESLMRVWRRLVDWSEDEARLVRTYLRLAESAELYAGGKAELLSGRELLLASEWADSEDVSEAWAERYREGFGSTMEFLAASEEARESEIREQEERLEAKRREQQRRIKILSAALLTAVVGMIFGIVGMVRAKSALADLQEAEGTLSEVRSEAARVGEELDAKSEELASKTTELNAKSEELASKTTELNEKSAELASKTTELNEKSAELASKTTELNEKSAELASKTTELNEKSAELASKTTELNEKSVELASKTTELTKKSEELETTTAELRSVIDPLSLVRLVEEGRGSDSLANPESWKQEGSDVLSRLGGTEDPELRGFVEELETLRENFDDRLALYQTANSQLEANWNLEYLRTEPTTGLREFWLRGSGQKPNLNGGSLNEEVGIVFVLVPGGTYRMGSTARSDEMPIRDVTLDPFLVSKYELTNHQASLLNAEFTYDSGKGLHPSMNRGTKAKWIELLAERKLALPTEAQWEFACRASTRTRFWFGDQASDLSGNGWYSGNATAPKEVGQLAANPFGLHDVHGNVWEWCLDENPAYDAEPRAKDGLRSGGNGFVRRGGSADLGAEYARSAFRGTQLKYGDEVFNGVRPVINLR